VPIRNTAPKILPERDRCEGRTVTDPDSSDGGMT